MDKMFVFNIVTVSNIALQALAGFGAGAVITVPLMLVIGH